MKSKLILLAAVLVVSVVPTTTKADTTSESDSRPCHWWQFRKCESKTVEGLPDEAPRNGTVITIDVATNTAYLFQDGSMVTKSRAATGTEKLLKKGRRIWLFHTPRGHLRVLRKIEDPVWRKPDWAYIEERKAVPPPDSPARMIKGHLGKYALDLGDGILIHGTDDFASIGRPASHGCIRLPDDMLKTLWREVPVGTDVYIFESRPVQTSSKERHSDLDF